jgi:hypothetical protein
VDLVLYVGGTALLFALVAVQRLRARGWRQPQEAASQPDLAASEPLGQRFQKVWFQTTPPRAALRAYKDRQMGDLYVDGGKRQALFAVVGRDAVVLTRISDVQLGGRGGDFVNTWIEVHGEIAGESCVVFLTDGAWLGWRPLLTRSNVRIVRSLAHLRDQSGGQVTNLQAAPRPLSLEPKPVRGIGVE